MSTLIPTLLILSVCLAIFSFVAFFLHRRATAARRAGGPVELDLGGRLPAQRRRPCGRHGGEGGGNCDDCEHKHEHDHAGADHDHCRHRHR